MVSEVTVPSFRAAALWGSASEEGLKANHGILAIIATYDLSLL